MSFWSLDQKSKPVLLAASTTLIAPESKNKKISSNGKRLGPSKEQPGQATSSLETKPLKRKKSTASDLPPAGPEKSGPSS